jgi:ketosteroid isomerase-like protein
MRSILVILFCLVIRVLPAQSPEDAIRTVMNTQSEAWNRGDVDGFMKYYWNDKNLTFVSKRGVSKGWQQVYDNYKKGYPNQEAMGNLRFDHLEFDKMSSTAYMVTGSWLLTYAKTNDNKREDVGGWFTLVFRKIKKEWLIVYDHTS